MEALYLVALGGFIFGAMGYIVVRFWAVPIMRYRRTKHAISKVLSAHSRSGAAQQDQITSVENPRLRRWAMDLTDIYHNDLPHWYKMLLTQRGEDPLEGSRQIMKLVNISKKEKVEERLEKIHELMGITYRTGRS
jgi:hypothetical protein